MKKVAFIVGEALVVFVCLLYVCDFAVFRYRLGRASAFATVTVNTYYAVPQKNGKTEYDFQSSRPQPCARSIFSHSGYWPCWYLRKHPDQEIKL